MPPGRRRRHPPSDADLNVCDAPQRAPTPPPPPPLAAACERPGELLVCSKCPNAFHPQCCGYGTPRMLRHLVGVGRHLTPGLSTANEFKNTHIKLQRPAGLDA